MRIHFWLLLSVFFRCTIFWDPETQTLSYYYLSAANLIHLSGFSIGTYFLLKRITNNQLISLACASLTTFCGCTLHGYHWSYIFIGFSWIPFFLLTYSKALDSKDISFRWIAVSAFILALIGTGSTSHGLMFTAVCMFFLFISYVIINRTAFLEYLKKSLCVGLLGLSMCAIQLFPFFQIMGRSFRYVNSANGTLDYAEYMKYTIPVTDMHQFLGQHAGWYAMSLLMFLAAIYAYKLKGDDKNNALMLFAKILFVFAICMVDGAFLPDLTCHIPGINHMREEFLWLPYLSLCELDSRRLQFEIFV